MDSSPTESNQGLDATPKATSDNKKHFSFVGCLQTFAVAMISAIIGVFIGAVIMASLFPYLFGINPIGLFKGDYRGSTGTDFITTDKGLRKYSTNAAISVAKRVKPSVVNIRTKKMSTGLLHGIEQQGGEGSGVIIRSDGHILTNYHVIQGADEIWVTIGDKPDVKAELIGRDSETDLAVIKVDKKELPAAVLGSSPKLKVGELTVAIGSPFGFEHTVTVGIVSALNRDVTTRTQTGTPRTYTNLIQTDAAINPGNSGGALCNDAGHVIGISTLIASTSGGAQGIGFAIPVNLAKDVADQLIKKGKVSHPYVGVSLLTVDEEVAQVYGLPVKRGALVARVAADTPAASAGIKEGDVITKYNGVKVKTAEDLMAEIRKGKVGDKAKITYYRDKDKQTVELSLAEKPQQFLE